MTGPNDKFNKTAASAARDPDPRSFPAIPFPPLVALLRSAHPSLPEHALGCMQKMEQKIAAGEIKRSDGYTCMSNPVGANGQLADTQYILHYRDFDDGQKNTGALFIGERRLLSKDMHAALNGDKSQLRDPRARTPDTAVMGTPYVGDGYYFTQGALIYNYSGNLLDNSGKPLRPDGRNALFNPNAGVLSDMVKGLDRTTLALYQHFDPQTMGLSRDLSQQVRQVVPNGARLFSTGELVPQVQLPAPGARPTPGAPGSPIPGAIRMEDIPDGPPPAGGAAPAAPPATPARPAVPLVDSKGQVNVDGLRAAVAPAVTDTVGAVRNFLKSGGKPVTPREPDGP